MGARRPEQLLLRLAAIAALAPPLAACSDMGSINVIPKVTAFDELSFKSGGPGGQLRPVTSADLIDPQGQCAGQNAGTVQGGIALQMTECEVVGRAGRPDNVELGTNDRGERSATLTYASGLRAGIYRFAAGRLYVIERGAEPPPQSPPPKKPPAKKPSAA